MTTNDKRLFRLSKATVEALPEEARRAYEDAKAAHDKEKKEKLAAYHREYNAIYREQKKAEREKEKMDYWLDYAKKEGYFEGGNSSNK